MSQVAAVILAAGFGKRMNSRKPKVMHKVCGRPMVAHVADAAAKAGASQVLVVIGPEVELFRDILADPSIGHVVQNDRLGTGHAVMQAEAALSGFEGDILVLLGDMPLLPASQLSALLAAHRETGAAATVLTAVLDDPTGYGRIVRGPSGNVLAIVEHRDATEAQLGIHEMNTGVFCFSGPALFPALHEITQNNDQNEYYLTDIVAVLNAQGKRVGAVTCSLPEYGMGVNSRAQLAEVGRIMRTRVICQLMDDGVTVVDPATTYVDAGVVVGRDTVLLPNTSLEGATVVGEDCEIGPSCRLTDATLGDSVRVQNSIITGSSVGDGCNIGPFAYIRPGSLLHEGVKVGDFVELKKAEIGVGSKIPHLSYVGDATVGTGVNIGCGTITCNYDGRVKHQTAIGDRAFVGSNVNLVAPVTLGNDVFVAAGSTVTKDVPDRALAVGRARQENKLEWRKRRP